MLKLEQNASLMNITIITVLFGIGGADHIANAIYDLQKIDQYVIRSIMHDMLFNSHFVSRLSSL
jgi:hypothetical protein